MAASSTASISSSFLTLFFFLYSKHGNGVPTSDVNLLEFPLNLEYLEAEFFSWGALGHGLDHLAPDLPMGGPPPLGATIANLDPFTRDIISQFAFQEINHLRAIKKTVKGFARPLLDLSAKSFAKTMDAAIGRRLQPPFDPYANSINFLITSYLIPYVGLTGYVGTNPFLHDTRSKKLVAGLLGVESGQDAVIRAMLYEKASYKVHPYGVTVGEFTERISGMRNRLGRGGVKDQGVVVGKEGKVKGNVLAGDRFSLSFGRSPREILRIVYGTSNESFPGGFFPNGAGGLIASQFLVMHP